MPRRRLLLLCLAAACTLVLGALAASPRGAAPGSERLAALYDPYAAAPLRPYRAFQDAVRSGDALELQKLADGSDGYLAYRASLELARWQTIDAATRLVYYRRVLKLRIHDPLARKETHTLYLAVARTAEQAGDETAAVTYYRDALPLKGAVEALKRLVPDRRALAKDFFHARLYQDALDVLKGVSDPEAKAQLELYLGNYDKALPLYRAAAAEKPHDAAVQGGLAWTLFNLKRYDAADSIFRQLSGANALYGRALIANKKGDVSRAVTLLEQTKRADYLWQATGLLEGKDRYAQAIPIYLELARGGTSYADDAAYRAYVLARRLGMSATAKEAESLVPPNSFFALKLGERLDVPRPAKSAIAGGRASGPVAVADPVTGSDPPAPRSVDVARALVAVHDPSAAVGELLFELRALGGTTDAKRPPTQQQAPRVVAIAQTLQSLGEYRQSVYAATELIAEGSRSLAVWRLAYPTAYAPTVDRQARAAGVSPALVWSVMRKESAFSPVAVSLSDAAGLMQVTPPTWDWLGQLQGDAKPASPFDARANIRYGTYYLGFLSRQFHGNLELAVSSYNRGQGYIGRLFQSSAVHGNMNDLYRDIDSYETREYMQAVMVNLATYEALYPGRFPPAKP